jgi:hypothetical protein
MFNEQNVPGMNSTSVLACCHYTHFLFVYIMWLYIYIQYTSGSGHRPKYEGYLEVTSSELLTNEVMGKQILYKKKYLNT